MSLIELRKEIEGLKALDDGFGELGEEQKGVMIGIKQTVEAVDDKFDRLPHACICDGCIEFRKDWHKIKELLK